MRLLVSSVVSLLVSAGALVSADALAADAHYTLDPSKSTLEYQFTQAGAQNKGKFTKFPVKLDASADGTTATIEKIAHAYWPTGPGRSSGSTPAAVMIRSIERRIRQVKNTL